MESLGVIEKVEEPTPWYVCTVVVSKKNVTIHKCVLNYCMEVSSEVHSLPKVNDTLAQVSGSKVFSNYTPFGHFKMPFGISSHFQKRMPQILTSQPQALSVIDDVFAANEEW